MNPQLHGAQKRTFEAIFQHPLSHNIQWREVRSMLEALADDVQEHEGNLKVVLNDKAMVFQQPVGKNVADMEELMKIRHFIERSHIPMPRGKKSDSRLLVVIDHREARIYEADQPGSVPRRIIPYDPYGFGRYLHNVQDQSDGQRKPERKSYYKAIARSLRGAGQILIFGSSTGASSAMEQLLSELKNHHHDIAPHVVGSYVIDEQHLSENQLLAKARKLHDRDSKPPETSPGRHQRS